ncbi:DNA-binding MarR family transcriptional regulator [Streptomyces aurantiacus]|uniref:MarR family winged helix-turn-helix transcriptional regulator n=1 Tax=Streptomyces aurantiacus TaxID=47760 RepID=UPI0027951C95|nr:MarR family transcriptional regulator [Streptomyces aurantiacus]MDQ0774395.1 DNA-binding MarR family transcriptional regulator [Streptomyces aurantiacus]
MSSVEPGDARRRRRLSSEIRESLRVLGVQLSLLNQQVGARLELKSVDVDCLDLINRHGPIGPSALARLAGLHPATLTGILDRLERGGWIARERDPNDRRATLLRPLRDRNPEILGLYAGMTSAVEEICADYDEAELALLADFLRRTSTAGRGATDELAER